MNNSIFLISGLYFLPFYLLISGGNLKESNNPLQGDGLDRQENNVAMYEDPIPAPVLEWATYFGGTSEDIARYIAHDAQGNIYITGQTSSTTGLALNGYQNIYGGGPMDAFIAKFSPAGVLLWGSYYGGTGQDEGHSIVIDPSGNLYLAGRTSSNGVIASNGHQNTRAGGYDGFLVKFNSIGERLWGTYYGGTANEIVYEIAMDKNGNIYMQGETSSSGGIAFNGFDNTSSGSDGFLVKFDSEGARQWGTYYGPITYCRSVTVDLDDNVYLSGMANQTGLSFNGHQNNIGGFFDGYLVKFNSAGARLWATYYGGSDWDAIRDIKTDKNNNVYICGETLSTNNIAFGGFQNTKSVFRDGYLVKFNKDGVRQWGTYYGGEGSEGAFGIEIDEFGSIYLAGSTPSTNNISFNGFQNTNGGGRADMFIVKFDMALNRLWGTYFGSTGEDQFISMMLSSSNSLKVAGYTSSTTGVVKNAYQEVYGGGSFDGLLFSINTLTTPPIDSDNDGTPDHLDCAPDDPLKWRSVSLFIDRDGDGYDGGKETVCYGETIPEGYKSTTLGQDCNDVDEKINGLLIWYKDDDNDGYSNGTTALQCDRPAGFKLASELISNTGDCDDAKNEINPETIWYLDADNDGYGNGTSLTQCTRLAKYKLPDELTSISGDCNNNDATIYPNAVELCDGKDNNCDGQTDEGCGGSTTWYRDKDGDGWGRSQLPIFSATQPTGYVRQVGDCHDEDPSIFPTATELPDGKDNNCNGQVDEGLGCPTWYRDKDGDGKGRPNLSVVSCVQPVGYVNNATDCNDVDASIYPNAPELPDGKDNDCDGQVDEGLGCATWYRDKDGDGRGRPNLPVVSCVQPVGYVDNATDCNDEDATIYPGAPELCDGKDNDCDGRKDEDCELITIAENVKPGAKADVASEKLNARVWPNPARTELMVSIDGFIPNKKMELLIMTVQGMPVQSKSFIPSLKAQQVSFDVKNLASGTYLLLIKQGTLSETKRVIIAR